MRSSNIHFKYGLLLLCGLAFFAINIYPLWQSLFFSLILAVNFSWAYDFLQKRMSRGWAASITSVFAFAVLAVPTIVVTYLASSTVVDFAQAIQDKSTAEYHFLKNILDRLIAWMPYLQNVVDNPENLMNALGVQENLQRVSQYANIILQSVYNSVISIALWLIVIIFGVYFILLEGHEALHHVSDLIPLRQEYIDAVSREFVDMTRTLTKVIAIIGLVQGALGGMLLWWVGTDSWFMWTFVMIVFSMMPIIGAGIVLLPTALMYALSGDVSHAWVVVFGFVFISTIDNFLKPKIVSSHKVMRESLVLLSTVGGMIVLGAIGVFAGPIFTALILAVFHVHRERTDKSELFLPDNRM